MDNIIKKTLRKSPLAIRIYDIWKTAMVWPLKKTILRDLSTIRNMPFKDLLKPSKIRLFMKVSPHTLAGYSRLDNIYALCRDVEKKNIKGCYIETGTWKGGCAAIMGAVAHQFGDRRNTWYLDSFEGMPDPTSKDGNSTAEIEGDVLKASQEDVEKIIFDVLKLPREKNKIVKGWFEDVLPDKKNEIGPVAILRIDADFYEPIKYVLEQLYDQVVENGYIIFDDFARWPGCRQAVREFVAEHKVDYDFEFIGSYGHRVMYLQKKKVYKYSV